MASRKMRERGFDAQDTSQILESTENILFIVCGADDCVRVCLQDEKISSDGGRIEWSLLSMKGAL